MWHTEFLWNPLGRWVIALLLFGVTFTLLPLIKGSVSQRRRKWAESGRAIPTAIEVLTLLIAKTSRLFIFTLAIALASTELDFPKDIGRYIRIAIVLTFWFQVGLWGMAAVRYAIDKRARRGGGLDPTLAGSIDIIVFVAALTIWAMAFLLAPSAAGARGWLIPGAPWPTAR